MSTKHGYVTSHIPVLLIDAPVKKGRNLPLKARANDLTGVEWTKNSISVWSDIKKSREELRMNHPAMFPEMLIRRLVLSLTREDQKKILDPFMGSGSTVIAAYKLNRLGIGFEISESFIKTFESRLRHVSELEFEMTGSKHDPVVYTHDAREVSRFLKEGEIDLCITSPPYWDILEQKRTADGKNIRNYGEDVKDLGKIKSYDDFLYELDKVWTEVYKVLKPKSYLVINVMDLRKKSRFYPFHIDIVQHCAKIGNPPFIFDDLIIWNRQSEYNNLRPLGFPYKFRINKIHEYLLIFQKPALGETGLKDNERAE